MSVPLGRATRAALLFTLWVAPEGEGREPSPAEPIALRLRYVPGRQETYQFVQELTVQPEKQKTPVKTRAVYVLRQKVHSVSGDDALLAVRLLRFAWSVDAPEGSKSFDTDEAPREREPAEFAAARGVIGRTFTASVDPLGRIRDMRGPTLPTEGTKTPNEEALGVSVLDLVGAQKLVGLLASLHAWMPDSPIRPGESWDRTEEAPLGALTLVRNNRVTLERIEGGKAYLQSRIEMAHREGKGLGRDDVAAEGSILAVEPGSARIVFLVDEGVVESLDLQVSFGLRVDAFSESRRKAASSVLQMLSAKTRAERLARSPTSN